MNKMIRILQNYLILGFMLVLMLPVVTYWPRNAEMVGWQLTLSHALGFHVLIWIVTFIIFLIMLVSWPLVREKTLARLANIKERDEREQYITGRAARASYLSTLSLTIFLLFISMFSVQFSSYDNANAEHKGMPRHSLSMSVHFQFFGTPIQDAPAIRKGDSPTILFSSVDYTPSKSFMMLILLCWQLLAFNWAARKEQHL